MKKLDIEQIIQARLQDAKVLLDASRFDGSVYLCGYAVELGLKACICKTLQWDEYPTTKGYQTFKTHDLDILLHLTGQENRVKHEMFTEWSIVSKWNPETRYSAVGTVTQIQATKMFDATKAFLEVL
ncbi:HEPN domain-containing protein [Candidatus Albibeggiatoa sp. nov. BB20]|uniref:HEPN domain-containing protein n=1 Tax=Candidatus Albibeggiatoa sp. nov. BB20 TaxID=3162723 RepID=UPI0033659953